MESVINKLAEIETAATKIMQAAENQKKLQDEQQDCLLYTSPSPRD